MKPFRIALLGFGVAGQAFSRILLEKKDEIARDTGYEALVGNCKRIVRERGDNGFRGQVFERNGRSVRFNEVWVLIPGDFFFRFRSRPIDELKFQQLSGFRRDDR